MVGRNPDWNFSILSSGHGKFIRKVLAIWREQCPCLPEPTLFDYELFQELPWKTEEKVKPSPRLLRFVLDHLGIDPSDALYCGDDKEKDGLMARDAGAPFILVQTHPEKPQATSEEVSPIMILQDWRELHL